MDSRSRSWKEGYLVRQHEDEAELCAKVILAAAGGSKVTIVWRLFASTVHGSVPGGAHARLERLARENPSQLLRLLERAQQQWPPSVYAKPTLPELYPVPVANSNWRSLGLALGLNQQQLTAIELKQNTDHKRKRSMFKQWLGIDSAPSWMTVIRALEEINEDECAEKVRLEYSIPSFVKYSDSQSRATVVGSQVLSVLRDLQESVRKYSAARVIHALADLEGVTVESSNGREKIISSTAELAGEGAYDHLMKMLEVDPNRFQRVLERAEPLLQVWGESTWRDRGVTVTDRDVLYVLRDLQEVLRCKKNVAAKTILALNAESGITILSLGQGEKCLTGQVAGGGAYAHLIKMAGEDPTHLQSLLERAEHLLQGAEKESTWRDRAVTVKNTAVLDVIVDLQVVLRRKNVAAKTILALNAESGITILSLGQGKKLLMGEVAGEGAYAHLIKMDDEDPTHLQSLLERAERLLQRAEKESTWRDRGVTVTDRDVLYVLRDLQEVLRCKKNVAAKTILALNAESGNTIRSLGQGEKLLTGQVAGEGAYAHLIKMADEDPTHLQSLLERAEHLLQGAEKGSTWRDGAVTVTDSDVLYMYVLRDLQEVLRCKTNVAATTILALNAESGITIQSLEQGEKLLEGEVAGGGAYTHLIKMSNEDPTHLQSLLERAEHLLQGAENGTKWRCGSSASVTDRDVLRMCHDLQTLLTALRNSTAAVILALAGQGGFTTRSSSGGEEIVSSEGAQATYDHLREMAYTDPTNLSSLLQRATSLLHEAEEKGKDLTWRDGSSPLAVTVTGMMLRQVCQSLVKLLLEEMKKNHAAKLILKQARKNPAHHGGNVQQWLKGLSGWRHYPKELKSLAQHPETLQHLLETTQSPILQHYKELNSEEDGQLSSNQSRLTVGDLAKVCEELYSIRGKWRDLALQLGVPVEKQDHIKATFPDSADCLRETVKEWLTNSPAPTWQALTTALESRTVNEHGLAERLKKEYCKAEVVRLEAEDLGTLHVELYDARSKWYDLGIQLGVKPSVLDRIRQQFSIPSDCLREVLQDWWQSSPCPTLEDVCAALRSCTVEEHALAQQLEEMYGPVAESGAEDGASSESGSRDLSPSELRETLEAIMTELQTLADSSHQQGGREEEPCTSQGKAGSCAPSGDSSGGSGSLPSSGDDSSDQESSLPPVSWELEARLLALQEGLAKMQQQEPARQQMAGDRDRRHETRHLRIPSGSPGPSDSPGPSSGCNSTCLSSSDDCSDSLTGSDQEWSPSQGGKGRISGRKRTAGGHVTTEETPPAKHLRMDACSSVQYSTSSCQATESSCQATKYDRLFAQFPQLIESLADTIPAENLADKLLKEKLITKWCWEEACLPTVARSQKIRPLIRAILSRVKLNDSNYDKFVSVLREIPGLQDIVQLVEGV